MVQHVVVFAVYTVICQNHTTARVALLKLWQECSNDIAFLILDTCTCMHNNHNSNTTRFTRELKTLLIL